MLVFKTWGQGDPVTGKSVKGQALREAGPCQEHYRANVDSVSQGRRCWHIVLEPQLDEYVPRAPVEMPLADQASSPETGCYTRAPADNIAPLSPRPVSRTLILRQNFKHKWLPLGSSYGCLTRANFFPAKLTGQGLAWPSPQTNVHSQAEVVFIIEFESAPVLGKAALYNALGECLYSRQASWVIEEDLD